MRFRNFALVALAASMAFTMGGCKDGAESVIPDDDRPDPPVGTGGRVIDEAAFKDPPTEYRPMVMMHASTESLVDDVFARGYGGVVTNVAWDSSYLQSDRTFGDLRRVIKHAVEDNGMYIWLYDEYGYPSGTAYGQTLKGNPEYEALGLVPQYKAVAAGETATIGLLYGHKRIVSAYVYDGALDSFDLASGKDLSSAISSDGTSVSYQNTGTGEQVLVAFMSKQWYENTHSMENWYAQQRYIDMLSPEPAKKFISLTYQKYYEELAQYFGKGIKAFFTDEPALQGSYFVISERQRQVLDEPDLDIPVVECLNFSESLFDSFQETYGYDLRPNLAYLYREDGSEKAKRVRMDFYALTSELFRTDYLGQIAEWCSSKGVKSSGHLLLEETLYQNPWFAGDMLQLLGTMGIPGSDLLLSKPQTAMAASCIVSKMASSAADFNGKTETFAEISGAFDGTAGDINDQINAVGVQVAMGINNFASYYYQGGDHDREEDALFTNALGRMKYMVTDSKHRADVAVYYPYEGVCAETLPSRNMYSPAEGAKRISDGFAELCKTLVQKQIDYDLVDSINLAACTVEEGALVTPQGERWKAIVLPYTTALSSAAAVKLREAAEKGVRILTLSGNGVVCDGKIQDAAQKYSGIFGFENVSVEKTSVAVANALRDEGIASVLLDNRTAANIYIGRRANEGYTLLTVVNAYTSEKEYTFTVKDCSGTVRFYNTLTGNIQTVNAEKEGDGMKFTFTLPANMTGFFVIG